MRDRTHVSDTRTDFASRDQYIRELQKKVQDLECVRLVPEDRRQDRHDSVEAQDVRERPMLSNGTLYKQGAQQLAEFQYFGASSTLGSLDVVPQSTGQAYDQISRSGSAPPCRETEQPTIIGHHAYDDDLDTNLHAVQAQLPSPEVIQLYIDKYFSAFAVRCPVLNESDFRSRVKILMQESGTSGVPDSFISVFLMVLCLGEYFAAGDDGTENVRQVGGWRFFISAYGNVREGLRRTNVEYMQATVLQVRLVGFSLHAE